MSSSTIAALVILVLSAAGIWILSWRGTSRLGWVISLAAQPFWLYVTFDAGQWVLFANAMLWTGAFTHGLVRHWNSTEDDQLEAMAQEADDIELIGRVAIDDLQRKLSDMTRERDHWMDSYNHYELAKKLAAETERADYAWRNTRTIEAARQVEMAKRDTLLAALEIAEDFISGFEGDELQEGIDALLAQIRAAIDVVLTEPHIETWTKKDQTTGFKLVAKVAELEFAGGGSGDRKPASSEAPAPRPAARPAAGSAPGFEDDDIPF